MAHAVITAGTKGIGRRAAETLLEKGYSVTINYRSDEQAAGALKKAHSQNLKQLQFVKADMTKKSEIDRLFNTVMERFGRIDLLVNNAGPFVTEGKRVIDHTDAEWRYLIDGNLSSVFYLVKQIIPVMREQRFGRIINYGFQEAGQASGWMNHGPFAAAKSALASLTRTLAIEEAEHGITVNMVCPGIIKGRMKEATILEAERAGEYVTPLGRAVSGEDIARLIAFLCENDSEMINGAVIDLTGTVDVVHRFLPRFFD